MNRLLFLLKKEFKQILRDKSILSMMLVSPILQLILMPLAANFTVKNVNIAYVDHDQSSYSHKLFNKILSSGYFKSAGDVMSYQDAMKLIEDSKADLILEIPARFERNLVKEGSQKIYLSLDAINATKSGMGSAYVSQVIADFNKDLDVNITLADANSSSGSTISISSSKWYNPYAEYKFFMVPGILVQLLTMIGGYMAALNIVKEKELGTIEQINVTPIKKWEFILGKLIPFWVIGMIVFTLGLIVMYLFYGIFPKGNIAFLYLVAAVYQIALLGLGLLVSTFSDNQLQSMFVSFMFMMIFMMMSGLFTSTDSMPEWAQKMSSFTPVTHFIKVVRLVILKGSGFANVKLEFLYIILFAVVLNTAAILNYKKTS